MREQSYLAEEDTMLIFQLIMLILVITYGKNKTWMKYLLVVNAFGWYICLQKRLQIPNAIGFLLPELIIILLTDTLYIWMSIRHKKAKTLKKENALLQEQISRYQLQIQQNESNQKLVYRIKHDLKNQLIVLNALLVNKKYEEAKQAIADTLGELSANNCIETGNVTLDNLLNYKLAIAKEKQISVEAEMRIPIVKKLDSMWLLIVIGNLLDNAIEACENVPIKKRYIKINMIQKDSRIFLEIENTFTGEIKTDKKGHLITTKKSPDFHGYGIRSIEKSLENIGDFIYHVEDNKFMATVIIY
jgi:sensor histidine kinase YesM